MARVPVWSDVCRSSDGQLLAREVCAPKAACACTTPVAQVAAPIVVKQTTSEVVKGTIRGVGPIAVAFVAVESLHAVVQCAQGKITKKQAIEKSVCSAAGGAGGVGGAAIGAVIGTAICPGIGTAIGGFIGSVLGGIGGRLGASAAMA